MWGGFYDDPKIMKYMQESLSFIKNYVCSPSNEVALILDENGGFDVDETNFHFLSYNQITELGFIGTSYDIYSIKDVNEQMLKKYKVLMFILPSQKERKRLSLVGGKGNYLLSNDEQQCYKKLVPSHVICDFLRKNNVHIYSEGNIVYASKDLLSVTSTKNDVINISLKTKTKMRNIFDKDDVLTEKDNRVQMSYNETRTYIIEKP